MDNLTHTLVGWALGQAGLKSKTRKGLAALMLGANAPDVDVLFGWVPWAPLATHRGVTHSLVGGTLILPLLVAAALWTLDRWQVRRRATFKSGLEMRFGWLLGLSFLGVLSHPLLDLQTSYSVQLFSPFDAGWWHSDSLFIIDLVLWSLLGLSIWWSRRRERRGGDWPMPAQAGLAAVLVYIALNLGLSQSARQVAPSPLARCGHPSAIYTSPLPGAFWRRDVVWRVEGGYVFGRFDPLKRPVWAVADCRPLPNGLNDPLVRAAIARDPGLKRYLGWSTMPLATVGRSTCSARVTIGDARYLDAKGKSRIARSAEVPLSCQAGEGGG